MTEARDRREADDDAIRSFAYAIARMREALVREHRADPLPNNEDEQRWAREGSRGHD